MYSLPVNAIDGVPIVVNIVPKGNPKVRPAHAMTPKQIAIHNTGNADKGADAARHNKLLHNQAKLGEKAVYASYQFVVDDKAIYQNIPLDESAWHTGDGSSATSGNRTSIGIEICENADGDYAKAEANAVKLVAYLLELYKFPISVVKPHQAFSGKYCPHIILSRKGGFPTFTKAVTEYQSGKDIVIDGSHKPTSPNPPSVDRVEDTPSEFLGKRLESIYGGKEGLNFYSAASMDKKFLVGVLKKGYGFNVIVKKVKVGTVYMYEVKNAKGNSYFITASPTYVKVVGGVNAPVELPKPVAGIKQVGTIQVANLKNFTYIYEKNSDTSKQLGEAKLGAKLPISGSVKDWYEVIYNGKRAYVKEKYAKRV